MSFQPTVLLQLIVLQLHHIILIEISRPLEVLHWIIQLTPQNLPRVRLPRGRDEQVPIRLRIISISQLVEHKRSEILPLEARPLSSAAYLLKSLLRPPEPRL